MENCIIQLAIYINWNSNTESNESEMQALLKPYNLPQTKSKPDVKMPWQSEIQNSDF